MTTFSKSETAAILAGLRLLQWAIERSDTARVDEVLTDGGVKRLASDEIEALCERINLDSPGVFVIKSLDGGDDGEPMYWSNRDGWGDLDSATRFSASESGGLTLPIGDDVGWVKVSEEA